ncbi:MAG: HD domain-containing protein [Rhodovibrionaceae bacterium]|nr:HD domain-containing protein [Rhodovibrionaceae bacterium]
MDETMTSVSFRRMQDGTVEDYALLERLEGDHIHRLPERVLEHLGRLENSLSGYRVTRLEHCLQSASRALRDGADIDWIVAALLHDIGDDLAPHNHDSFAAEILKPYLREECVWVVRHHGIFQLAYYGDKIGLDPNARRKYADNPNYEAAVTFCERWDQTSFDPDYDSEPLSTFVPMVYEVFRRPPWNPEFLRPGVHVPLVAGAGAHATRGGASGSP